jgi:peptidoglycan/xylan/chitin deacetylase (PgdA/CDA1 family)
MTTTFIKAGLVSIAGTVLLIAGLLYIAPFTLAAGANLVPNGDLETASATPSVPQGWITDKWGTLTAKFTYPVAGHNSAKAAKVQLTKHTSGDAKWMFNHIPVTPGTEYVFTDDYNSNVASSLTIEYTLSNGKLSYVWVADLPSSANAWKTYTAQFTPPAGAVSMSMLHTIQKVGVLTIDNVSVAPVSSVPPPPPAPTCTLSANPASIAAGSSSTLMFSSQNASAGSINNGVGDVAVSGTKVVSPAVTTLYTGTFTGPGGTTTCSANVTVTTPPPPPTPKPVLISFTATPSTISLGSTALLAWSVTGASSTSIDQGVGVVAGSSKSVSPTQTITYTLTATNPGGSVSTTTTVTVVQPPPPPPPAKPVIGSFTATPASIAAGSSAVLSWTVTGASSTSIDQGVGTVTGSSKSVSPAQTTTYTLTATNPGGSVTAVATVTVTPPVTPPSSNLIANGNLEAGTGATPTGWHSDYWGSLKATFAYPVGGIGSAKGAKITVTKWKSGDAKWWFDHIKVSSNTIYQFTEDYTSSVVTNVSVEFLMSDGTYQYQWVADEPVAASGGKVNVQITVPQGAVSMTVLHALVSNGTLTIDNASLVALPPNPFPTGMVSLVFDDGLLSQYNSARPILTAANLSGVYAIITQGVKDVSGDNASMTWAQIATLQSLGNEIASHTRTHPFLTELTSAQLQSEVVGAYSDLVAKGFTPKTFVYPYGDTNPTVEAAVKAAGYIGARGSYWGMNSPTADTYALYDVRVDKTTTAAQINALIDQTLANKRWLVLEIHDVLASGGDSEAITPATLQAIVDHIKSTGIKTVTLQEGMSYMQ